MPKKSIQKIRAANAARTPLGTAARDREKEKKKAPSGLALARQALARQHPGQQLTEAHTARQFPARVAHPDGRVKTSVILLSAHVAGAKQLARASGMSFNGILNLALYKFLFDAQGQSMPLSLPRDVAALIASRPPRPPARERITGETVFTRPRLDPEEDVISVTFDEARRIWAIQGQHPKADYVRVAKLADVPVEAVLAAEAAQDDATYQRWVRSQK